MFFDEELSYILSEAEKKRKKVNIKVDHPGILEVPPGKKVNELPLKHFLKLVKKYGYAKVIRALNNLYIWNKRKNPKLAKWAKDMEEKVRESVKGAKAALFESENEKVSEKNIKEIFLNDIKNLYNTVLDGISKEYEKSLELHSKLCEEKNDTCKTVGKSLSSIIKIFIYSYSKISEVKDNNISLEEFLFKNTKDVLSESAKSIVMKINQTTNIKTEDIKTIVKNIFNMMKREEYRDDLNKLQKLLIFSFYENTYYIYNPNVVEITKIIGRIIKDGINEYGKMFESVDEKSKNTLGLELFALLITSIFHLNDEILRKNILVFIDSIQRFSQTSTKFEKEIKNVVENAKENGIISNENFIDKAFNYMNSIYDKYSGKIRDVNKFFWFVDDVSEFFENIFEAGSYIFKAPLVAASVVGSAVSFLAKKGNSMFGSSKKFFISSGKKILSFFKKALYIFESDSKRLRKEYIRKIRRIDLLAEFYFKI